MKFNVSNNENKIMFTFECDFTDPIVKILFDAIQNKQTVTPEIPAEKKEIEIPKQEVEIPKQEQEKPRTKRRTKAEMELARQQKEPRKQFTIDFQKEQEPEMDIVTTETPIETETTKISEIHVPPTVTLKFDINGDSEEKMNMDIEALKIMINGDKLAALKYVKEKSGLDLSSSKTYCDKLWDKHLKES
jgi:ribosomal protein L7/L12